MAKIKMPEDGQASSTYMEGTPTSTEEQGLSPGHTQVDMHHLYLYYIYN